jgi:TP901 family phage tail tape measure protein
MTAPSGATAAAVWVDVLPNMKGFGAALGRDAAASSTAAGAVAGKSFGKAMLVGVAAIAGGAALAGKALFDIGRTFEEVTNTIRVGTGATGKALDALVNDAKQVGKGVPQNFEQVGVAVADLNTRLGLTGKPLQDSATQFLNLSRITGTDLQSNISSLTRVFGDWSIASEDQSVALDKIFRASQSSGVGIDSLSQNVVKFGAPMRQLGFSFDETLALLGKFDKEGVNTELVMGSMRIALGKMARAGEEPIETYRRVTEEIKNAGDSGKANALALELFGARAGPDMAAAIREGRFELGDMVDAIANGGDTINAAAADTLTFADSWAVLKNRGMAALEPIATRLFTALADGLGWITTVGAPAVARFGEALGGYVLPAARDLGAALSVTLVPALVWAGQVITGSVVPALAAFAGFIDRNKVPIGVVAGLIAAVFIPHLIALGVTSTVTGIKTAAAWVVTQVSAVRAAAVHSAQVVAMVARWVFLGAQSLVHAGKVAASWLIVGGINAVAATVGTTVAVAQMIARWVVLGAQSLVHAGRVAASWVIVGGISLVAATVATVAAVAQMVARWVFLGAQSLIQAGRVAAAWLIAMGPIGLVIAAVVGVVAVIIANWDKVRAATIAAWNAVSGAVATAWAAIKQAFTTSVAFVQNLWNTFWATLQRVATTVWNAIRAAIDIVWNAIKTGFNAAVNFIAGLWNRFWDGLRNVASTVFGAIRSTIDTVWGAIRSGFSAATSFVAGVWGSFWGGLRTVATTVFGAIRGTIDTVLGAVQTAFRTAVDVIGRVWGGIRSLLAKPINFMINTVYMGGIKKAWDVVAGILPGIGPLPAVTPIPEFARGGPVGRDMLLRAGEAGPEYVLSNPAVKALGGLNAVDRWHRELVAQRPSDFMRDLNSGRMVEGADHDGPGSRTTGFGGVRPHVAQAGHFLQNMFGIGSVGGVGQRANASDHPKGLALDFMTYNDQAKGDRLVNYLTPRAGHFAVKYIIWRQRINSGSGWRGMEDRGSPTANHFDHPHVSFLPGPGGEGGFSGEGGFFDIKAWIREQLEGVTNPVISALRNAFPVPPRFNEIPPSAATKIRDSALDFLLGKAFDSGGLASGRGLMFKNINEPERVLSPRQTAAFEQLVAQLSGGPIATPVADRGTADGSDGLGQKFDELIALLRDRPFAPITVEDRSGDPGETARSVQLALRMNR